MKRLRLSLLRLLLLGLVLAGPAVAHAGDWVTAWTTAMLSEKPSADTPPLRDATIRQVVKVTLAGSSVRLRFANTFGAEPLRIGGVRVGLAALATEPGTDWQVVHFGGRETVTIAPGETIASDPVELPVAAGTVLSVASHVVDLPQTLTVHTASRSNSVVFPGNALSTTDKIAPTRTFTRWYFLSAVDVLAPDAAAVALLGDSIVDGYGCPPDSYARWPDVLASRLRADPATARVAVLNLGIGGNRLLRAGLGPRALDRVDRDIFGQHGLKWLVLALGINDIGTRLDARKKGESYASADEIIAALRGLAQRARQQGIKVIGATITPYAGAGFYWSEDGEADRQAINRWIRTSGAFDAVLDFDNVLRDPAQPDRLAADFDSGDHLHPSLAGYRALGESVPLTWFQRSP